MGKGYFAHESAVIDDGAHIGEGTFVWHFSHVAGGARIGKDCKLGQNVYIAPKVTIGDNVKVQNNVSVYEGVILEDHVFCGPSMVFTNIINPRCLYPRNSAEHFKTTLVKNGSSIGANATVVCGVTIGCHAFVGAGSVVTKDVGDYELVYGNPARRRGWMCECGVKLEFGKKDTALCEACFKEYEREEGEIKRTR